MNKVIGFTFRSLLKASVACGVLSASSAWAEDGAAKDQTVLDEITVVGSRLARGEDGPAPVTIFDRQKIEALGVTSISDALKYLPQQSFNTRFNSFVGGAQAVNLRGLAVGSSLVLINGRRAVPGAGAISAGFFDLNSIPLAAVERIEVLADSASAVYGADAVGGVVNIVLKSSLSQPVFDAYYGAAEGGAAERRGSLSVGGSSGRARGLVVFDYFKRDALMGSDRDRIANADYRRFGGLDSRVLLANPGNICASSGNLPGIGAPCAAVPAGGGAGLKPSDFLATAGQQNLVAANAAVSYVMPSEVKGVLASGAVDLWADAEAFGELMYTDRRTTSIGAYTGVSNAVVPASNPFNPFGVPVRATFRLSDRHPQDATRETASRQVAGLKGRVSAWDWELALTGAQSIATYNGQERLDSARVTAALNATTPAAALNVFQAGPGGSEELLRSLRTSLVQKSTADTYQLSGQVRGRLFNLPAGPIQVALGGEWRKEKVVSVGLPSERTAYSGYSEFRAPLTSERFVGFLGDIALTLAGRYDHYSDFGGTLNGQYGIEWRPAGALLLRASYGDSFRAPTLFQLFQPAFVSQNIRLSDPVRNETPAVTVTQGGNPNLRPEISNSLSVGGVWTPAIAGRPRISASYWRITQESRLSSFPYQTLLANETYIASGVIIRAPATPADAAAGRPGVLTAIDVRLLNQGALKTDGLDLEATAGFETRWGRLSPQISATFVNRYQAQDFPSTPKVERSGIANAAGSVPRWKAVGALSWSRGPLSVTGTGRYVSRYADVSAAGARNGLTVDAQTLFDLQLAFKFDQVLAGRSALAQGLMIRAGAVNLFNVEPRFSTLTTSGYDPSQGDLRGRFLYVAASKSF